MLEYLFFFEKKGNQQVTNKFLCEKKILVGTSETLRLTQNDFDFTEFYLAFDNKKKIKKQFLEWFIGFFEGDGCLYIGNNGLEFKITQTNKDTQVLHKIKEVFGFGKVSKQHESADRFLIRDKENLFKIILILNGNLCLEKRQRIFAEFLRIYNIKYKTDIKIKPFLVKPLLSNGWLAGFADAEGCFNIYVGLKKKPITITTPAIQVRFFLTQQDKVILDLIASFFKGKVHFYKKANTFTMTVNFSFLKPVILYFKKFPLQTKKSICFTK